MSACKQIRERKRNGGTGTLCMHPKEISVRERKAVAAYMGGAATSKRSALRSAGYSRSVVEHQGAKFFRRPRVRQYMMELFETQGITEPMLAAKMKDLLNATRLQSVNFKTYEVPDNATRARVLELAAKCIGWLEENVQSIGIGFFDSDEAAEVLQQARGLVTRYDAAVSATRAGEGGAAAAEAMIISVGGPTVQSGQEQKSSSRTSKAPAATTTSPAGVQVFDPDPKVKQPPLAQNDVKTTSRKPPHGKRHG